MHFAASSSNPFFMICTSVKVGYYCVVASAATMKSEEMAVCGDGARC